jgi:lysozyme
MAKISQKGVDLIKSFEGCVLHSYQDPVGVWTIGYGHISGVTAKSPAITQEHADILLAEDLDVFEKAVSRLVEVNLTQGQYDALVSFAYNLGWESLRDSTLLKLVNLGKFDKAQDQFQYWVYADGEVLQGLVRRRAAEANLFGSK